MFYRSLYTVLQESLQCFKGDFTMFCTILNIVLLESLQCFTGVFTMFYRSQSLTHKLGRKHENDAREMNSSRIS